jgi:hypothetical protein
MFDHLNLGHIIVGTAIAGFVISIWLFNRSDKKNIERERNEAMFREVNNKHFDDDLPTGF